MAQLGTFQPQKLASRKETRGIQKKAFGVEVEE